MLDINGQELREGAAAQLLCEILAIEDDGVRVRVMNSELEILVGTKHDEVLGGWVADSELTAFEPVPAASAGLPVLEFLQTMEAAFPPPASCHHVLVAAKYGSEEKGWDDRLTVQVNMGDGTFQAFFLNSSDLKKPVTMIVGEIVKLLNSPSGNMQLSTKAGEFTNLDPGN